MLRWEMRHIVDEESRPLLNTVSEEVERYH